MWLQLQLASTNQAIEVDEHMFIYASLAYLARYTTTLPQALLANLVSQVGLFSVATTTSTFSPSSSFFPIHINITIARALFITTAMQMDDIRWWRFLVYWPAIMAYNSVVVIVQSTYIKLGVVLKFIRYMLHSVTCSMLKRWLKSLSLYAPLAAPIADK